MERRDFLKTLGATALTATVPPMHAQETGSAKPNIVLCMADDQGWGDMGYNGHPVLETPHFDAMASEAVRFDRFYAAAPVCSPTRGSVMTGRHPNRFGCFSWGHTLRPQEITVAEVFKKAGYVTGHFGKWHLGPTYSGSPVNPGASGFDEWLSAPNFFDNDPILSHRGKAVQTHGESSMVTVEAAIEFMRTHAGKDRPFLAVVWFGSPHRPHRAAPRDRALYPGQPAKLQHFYGEISGMDRAFGTLRSAIRDMGLRDDTILWYCSDNGGLPGVGSTGGRRHKGSLYEGGLRVPALFEWPRGATSASTTSVPCNTSDILPTLAALAGIPLNPNIPLDGIDLEPVLRGMTNARQGGMGFWSYPAKGISTPSEKLMAELMEVQKQGREITDADALRMNAGRIAATHPDNEFPGHAAWLDWPWKLHRTARKQGAVDIELYDLANDPMETENVATQHPDRTRSMGALLRNWQRSVIRSLNGRDYL